MSAAALADRLGARRVGAEYVAACPVHNDGSPSLNFRDRDGHLVATCRAGCRQADLWAELKRQHPDLLGRERDPYRASPAPARVTRYTVRDAAGVAQAVHVREDRADGKRLWWETATGGRGLAGRRVVDLPLYRCEHLAEHVDDAVLLCEGERAADAAAQHGLLAVGTVTGASAAPGPAALDVLRGRRVVLWPDADDPGRLHMRRLARALDGIAASVAIVTTPHTAPRGWDCADLPTDCEGAVAAYTLVTMARPWDAAECDQHGSDTCETCHGPEPAEQPDPQAEPADDNFDRGDGADRRYAEQPRFRGARAWMSDPRPPAIVDGVAWAGCITVLVSESGTGKTFLLLDTASATVAGRPWRVRTTRRGTVAYVTWEGDSLGLRLRALDEAGRETTGIELLRLSQPLSARPGRDGAEGYGQGEAILAAALAELAQRLALAGRPPIVLLVLDTLRASMAGSEDSSEDTAAYLRAVRRILAPYPGAGAIVAHHAGWQDSAETRRRRERGSSAIRGNVDCTLYLEAGDYDEVAHVARLTLSTLKIRDDERPAPLRLIRRRVDLRDRDDRGRIVTSCVIDDDPTTPAQREAEDRAEAAHADAALDAAILATVARYPITGLRGLAPYVRATCGPRRDDVIRAALDRLIAEGRIIAPARQRQPYTVSVAQ